MRRLLTCGAVALLATTPHGLAGKATATQSTSPAESIASLRAKVAALQAELDGARRDYQVLLATCNSASANTIQPQHDGFDAHKFDKVYETGKALDNARFLSAVGVSPRQFEQLLLAFDDAVSMASDRATTKAETDLVGKYFLVKLKFDLGVAQARTGQGDYGQ